MALESIEFGFVQRPELGYLDKLVLTRCTLRMGHEPKASITQVGRLEVATGYICILQNTNNSSPGHERKGLCAALACCACSAAQITRHSRHLKLLLTLTLTCSIACITTFKLLLLIKVAHLFAFCLTIIPLSQCLGIPLY